MLSVHFVEHHLDVFPLTDFVETMAGIVINATGGSLIGHEGEHGLEQSLAGFCCDAVLAT